MLHRLALRDVVLVSQLELELNAGFSVLSGETGAGKSILIDALQLALGARGDAGLVREGAARAEVSAEFDVPAALRGWLDEAGFGADADADGDADADADADGGRLLLRRSIDTQGKSRAWINGRPATVAQLREAGEALVDIHGQHAWQSLTRPAAVRALLDAQAGADTTALAAHWQQWKAAEAVLADARARTDSLQRERERLAWQIGEVAKLAPGDHEWDELNAEHQRLAHAQGLLDGARAALAALSEEEPAADARLSQAITALQAVAAHDVSLQAVVEVLHAAQAQVQDAAHTLHGYLGHNEPDPQRLAQLDDRLAAWLSLARRYRRAPNELPALFGAWQAELRELDASADIEALHRAQDDARERWHTEALRVQRLRRTAAPKLAAQVTQAMQTLGMAGGAFEVALVAQDSPQSFGLESVELRVAGHAGSTPRALAKVASGGELSRLALAIAVTTSQRRAEDGAAGVNASIMIFDEIDAGVGGTVAYAVGRLMKQLGASSQVLAVTHLAQVAACADHHFQVSKASQGAATLTQVGCVTGEERVAEVARMLGGERLTLASRAHAEAMLSGSDIVATPKPKKVAQ